MSRPIAPLDFTRPRRRSDKPLTGRRLEAAERERRFIVLPSKAGRPEQFTAENIAEAMRRGRERRDGGEA